MIREPSKDSFVPFSDSDDPTRSGMTQGHDGKPVIVPIDDQFGTLRVGVRWDGYGRDGDGMRGCFCSGYGTDNRQWGRWPTTTFSSHANSTMNKFNDKIAVYRQRNKAP